MRRRFATLAGQFGRLQLAARTPAPVHGPSIEDRSAGFLAGIARLLGQFGALQRAARSPSPQAARGPFIEDRLSGASAK